MNPLAGAKFLEPAALALLVGVGALAVVATVALALGALSRARFYGEASGRPWASAGGSLRRVLGTALTLAALAAVCVGVARPAFNPRPVKVPRSGRDLVFLIDVSRSMLAQDVRPTRLDRAKLLVRDVLDVAEGDRVGVVAFAGNAVVRCPLTTDYAFVRTSLDDVAPDSVGRGGTAIGEAIRVAAAQLFPEAEKADTPRARTIILITDGEDHESKPVEAAKSVGDRGVRVVAIGLGSELSGAPVPAADQSPRPGAQSRYLEYGGRQVLSRMDPATLDAVARATPGGTFLNAGTGNIDMDEVYRRLVRPVRRGETAEAETMRYTELFQLLIGLALALLVGERLLHVGRR